MPHHFLIGALVFQISGMEREKEHDNFTSMVHMKYLKMIFSSPEIEFCVFHKVWILVRKMRCFEIYIYTESKIAS